MNTELDRFSSSLQKRIFVTAAIFLIGYSLNVYAARLKDIANVKGVRENILIGYGIVVGLKGTGDSSNEFTNQSLTRLFSKLGLETQANQSIKSKNAAMVIVTSKLPAFARVGNSIDVSVSSIGDAASLEGGTLLVTPLRAGDQNVYAVAQGQLTIQGLTDGSSKNYPTVARISGGATIEKDLDTKFSSKKSFRVTLHQSDFTTAARVVHGINAELSGKFAQAQDSATIDVIVPGPYEGNVVELMAILESVQINVDTKAKVILNEKTGTVVMGSHVTLLPVAIAHGDLQIQIGSDVDPKKKKSERILEAKSNVSVSDLVKSLNLLGVSPKDLTAILQTLKSVGALQADLEVM